MANDDPFATEIVYPFIHEFAGWHAVLVQCVVLCYFIVEQCIIHINRYGLSTFR